MRGAGRSSAGFRPDWAAVGALGGVAAAIVAFFAYALPRPSPAPPAQDAGIASPQVPEPKTPVHDASTAAPQTTVAEPSATAPQTPDTRPPLSLEPLLASCQEALAVVDRYYRNAGSTELSQQAAATEAYQGMMRASLSADGAVYSVTVALSRDFSDMRFILTGMVSGDYAARQARTNRDAQTLRDVCGAT
ncbi:hypothetical protein GA0074695_2867 [Micromonospora viridifaciens]|uniref:Uncharacterized protein n=1 Tax=Micromonospora viridifaciens TaxID=1881 RepID=A0A1C4WYU7_MICVI|nr:hypothetical protein [Micromonospora viridifaciens]SCF01379.1 hypothetical protein GA0074695_2867 [Micromonospora viridifaciens]